MKKIFAVLAVILAVLLFSCTVPAQDRTLALRGGKFYTVSHGIIEGGVLFIRHGKIAALGDNVAVPENVKMIDASDCTIVPGFIDAFTNLGTVEHESIGQDYDEASSPLTPQLWITDAIDPENAFIPLARKMGTTAALCAPGEGNLLSGQSALIRLKGGTVKQMVIRFPVAVHGSLGELPKMRYGQKGRYPSTRMGEVALLRQTLIEAGEYLDKVHDYQQRLESFQNREKKGRTKSADKPLAPPADFKLQSLIPVLEGSLPLVIRANRMDDILSALRLAEEFNLRIVVNHGTEAYRVAGELAARNIPVLVGPYAEDKQSFETSKAARENASLLHKAGVRIAFQSGSYEHFADLLNQARLAVSYGLPGEEALRALTLSPAQIFGVEDRLGSLDEGKTADIVIFDKDPFGALSRIKMVIIAGEIVEDFRDV